ncbi:MAG: DNA mismatch repair endonuclease MutL, partial [Lentisphaerae bacterium]|nr:DNA mismatch repair endonuclease MutL [Lentisphaerota bacterium]
MSIIRTLAPEVANRIAAGEVIERPASVVKELVENALDAGAGRIRIQTSHGGQRLIQVTDDGCGMDRDDAMMCLEAHATSKIRDLVDVGQIQTLGFRGEALPSIASVSRFLLQTRQAESPSGTEVLVEAGVLREVRDCGCAPGTNVRVTHLFGNLPARRKFLRSPDTEDAHIHEVILLQALAHPGVAFEYLADQREAVRVAATGDQAARLGMLMGREVLAEMLPVDYEEAGIRVHGFTGKPGLSRSSRKEQRIIVNGRPASAETVYFAIKEAYSSLVLKERYAPVVLYLELPPELVDVNVHPSKREVRFREARLVGQVVSAAVGRALRGMVSLGVGAGAPGAAAAAADATAAGAPPAAAATGSVAPPAARPFRLSPGPQQLRLPVRDLPPAPAAPAAGSVVPATSSSPRPPPAAAPAPSSSSSPSPSPSSSSSPSPSPSSPAPSPSSSSSPSPSPSSPAPSSSLSSSSSPSSGGGREDLAGLRILGMLRETYVVAAGPRGLVLIDPVAAQQRV